jgi:hypothetical protein
MKTRACLLLLLAWMCSVVLGGCSEVESCTEGNTPGCLNTTPDSNNRCLFDLVLVDGLCVKPGTASAGGACGGPCPAGALCDTQREPPICVNFCERPAVLPGSVAPPEAIYCEAIATEQVPSPTMLTFAEVCTRRCRLNCQRLAQFCPGYQCPPGACDGADVQTECLSDCPAVAGANDLACITRECNDSRFARCDGSRTCPNGATPRCSSISCSNECTFGGKGVTGNGICDDGDAFSSVSAQCGWGTDCADCGPRDGTVEPLGGPASVCQYTLNCDGGTGSPDTAGAWCVGLSSIPGLARCAPDCSRGQACAPGFSCKQALFDQGSGPPEQIEAGGFKSSACLPDACE